MIKEILEGKTARDVLIEASFTEVKGCDSTECKFHKENNSNASNICILRKVYHAQAKAGAPPYCENYKVK